MQLISKIKDDVADVVHVQATSDSGETVKKILPMKKYIELLTDSMEDSHKMVAIGQIPNGYYDGKIHPYEPDTFSVTIALPKGLQQIVYGTSSYSVPVPGLVFVIEVKKQRIIKSVVYAYKGELTEDSPLYHYPFGNVYCNGKICWGGNSLPKCNVMKDVDKVIALFFGSPTNDDLYSPESNFLDPPEYVLSQRAFLEFLKGKDEFPENILMETGNVLAEVF